MRTNFSILHQSVAVGLFGVMATAGTAASAGASDTNHHAQVSRPEVHHAAAPFERPPKAVNLVHSTDTPNAVNPSEAIKNSKQYGDVTAQVTHNRSAYALVRASRMAVERGNKEAADKRVAAAKKAEANKRADRAEKRKKLKAAKPKPAAVKNYPNGPHGWVNEALAKTHTSHSWHLGVYTIGKRESNFRPKAKNNWDINAKMGKASEGVMQTIPDTFHHYHQAGTSNNIHDPVANISAAINYIKDRYGSIHKVQQANPNKPPLGY